jgi:hypothetical protein
MVLAGCVPVKCDLEEEKQDQGCWYITAMSSFIAKKLDI